MAFVWKHPKSRFFYAGFVDKTGTRLNRSTKSTNRREAQRIAEEFEAASRSQRTARQTRRVIAELHQKLTGERLRSPSFRAFSEGWLSQKQPEVSTSTMHFYSGAVMKFTEFLGPKADEEMASITNDDLIRFRNEAVKKVKPRTVNHHFKCLRMLFRAAIQDQVISEDPSEFIKTVRNVKSESRRPFTVSELNAVLTVADDEWQSMIRFGFYTGQRLGDIARLTWKNVDLSLSQITLKAMKTGKTTLLPIAAPLLEHIQKLPVGASSSSPLHPRAFKTCSTQGRTSTLSNQFGNILARAGLREKVSHAKRGNGLNASRSLSPLTFHSLRHTAVSLLKDAGVPQAVVEELVGHDSEQMSAHYTHVGHAALQKAAASFPKI